MRITVLGMFLILCLVLFLGCTNTNHEDNLVTKDSYTDILRSEIDRVDLNLQSTLEAEKSYALACNSEDIELKRYYLINAYYHDPNKIEYAKAYFESLDPEEDYSKIEFLSELLESAVYQIDCEYVEETAKLINRVYASLLVDDASIVSEELDAETIDYSEQFNALLDEIKEKERNSTTLTDKQFALMVENQLTTICNCFSQISEPTEIQSSFNQSCLSVLEYCSYLKNAIEIKESFDLSDDKVFLYMAIYPYLSQLLYAVEAASVESNLPYMCNNLKTRCASICLELYALGEEEIISYLREEVSFLLNDRPNENKYNKARFDSYYNSLVNLGNSLSQYLGYGFDAFFFVELQKLSEQLTSEVNWVSGKRYIEYQKWSASVMSSCDEILKRKDDETSLLIAIRDSGYFLINPELLSYQLKSWFDSIDLAKLKKKNETLFFEFAAEVVHKSIEDF